VRWCLGRGADPNDRPDWEFTPLSAAILQGSLCTVKLMLQNGADSRIGQQLHFAVLRSGTDQLALIEMLLAFGSDIDAIMYHNDAAPWREHRVLGAGTPLHKAAENGRAHAVAMLLDHGADWTKLDAAGRTPYELAMAKGYSNICEMIEARSGR
jgi:ankyrin repeat protein